MRPEAQRPVKQRRRATAPPSQPKQPAVVATAGRVEQAEAEPRQASQRPGMALLVQLDRARESPIGARLAEILMNMPDGRDLLAGTGLGILEAFDVLLVATPDPPDRARDRAGGPPPSATRRAARGLRPRGRDDESRPQLA